MRDSNEAEIRYPLKALDFHLLLKSYGRFK